MPAAKTPEQRRAAVEAKKNAEMGLIEATPVEPVRSRIRKAPENPQRKTRGVFNGTRGKLKISDADVQAFKDAGWTLHIFNDTAGRIDDALSMGYEFVDRDELSGVVANVVDGNTDMGSKVRFRVGMDQDGNGQFAYLMKIPTSLWEAEYKELQRKVDRVDAAIKAGRNVGQGHTAEGFYNAGINIQSKLE